MNILQQFLDAIEYRINDGWQHLWSSYQNAQVIGCSNDYASMQIVFLPSDQTVIEITATSELEATHQTAYRWMNPDFKEAIYAEADSRKIDRDEAFDDMSYIDLEVVEDVLEKGKAMLANEPFDSRVQVPLDLDDATLMRLFKLAHERDITLNQLLEQVLTDAITSAQPKI